MTRREIRRDEETSIRAWAAMAIEASSVEVVGFYWNRLGSLRSIAVRSGPESERDITQHEIAALAAVGIHPGADGWEIEEAPAVKVGDLFRSRKSGETWTVERWLTTDALWAIRCADGGTLYMTESDLLDPAQWAREAPANARTALPPGFGWYEHGHESYGLDRRRPGGEETIAKAHHDGYSWTWSILSTFARTTARDLREAQERAEDACRAAGLFDAAPAPDLGAKVAAIHDAMAGAPLRALVFAIRNDALPVDLEARLAVWGESLKSELRASLPAPRTTDGALTAYLLEHYRDAWRPGEDALALAIRLLGTQRHAIDMVGESLKEAREEARVTDESNAELAAELGKVRGELHAARHHVEGAKRREAEVEAEAVVVARERDEARTDLATLRQGIADLAAKMGAPHG